MLSDVALTSDGVLPAYRQAVTYRGGPLVVQGVAGSGKTSLIEDRFCWMVEQGTAPERLIVLTPFTARTDALRARLEGRLQRGYEELHAVTPVALASLILTGAAGTDLLTTTLSAGDRLAMMVERIDELPLQHHDFGGSANALLGGFVRRIDRLKAELISAENYAGWAAGLPDSGEEAARSALEREFAAIYAAHERLLAEAEARDNGDLMRDALRLVRNQPGVGARF